MNSIEKSDTINSGPIRLLLLALCITSLLPSCRQKKPSSLNESLGNLSVEQSDSVVLKRANSFLTTGYEQMIRGNRDSALYYFKTSLDLREKIDRTDKLIENYIQLGGWYYNDFKFESANKYYEKASVLAEEINSPPSIAIPIFLYLATCKREMKDLPTAKSIVQRTITLLQKPTYANDSLLAKCYNILSSIAYITGNHDEAIQDLQKEIRLVSKSDMKRELSRLYSNAALIYTAKKQYAEALKFLNQSMAHDLKWNGPNSNQMAILCMYKGEIFQRLGENDSARFFFMKNLKIRRHIYGPKHANTFGAYYTVGGFFSKRAEYDSAIHYYQHSIISLIKNFNDPDWTFNPSPTLIESNKDLILALVAKANSLQKLHGKRPAQPALLVTSLKTYFLADSVFNVSRSNFIFDDPQLAQMEEQIIPYDKMISLAFTLYEIQKDKNYLNQAFEIMERSRAVLLQDALHRAETFNQAGIPSVYKERENHLIRKRSSLLFELAKDLSPLKIDSLNNELLKTNTEQLSLEEEIAKMDANYYQIKYREHKPKLEELIELMKEKKAVFIEYQWNRDRVYALVISSRGVKNRVIGVTDEFKDAFAFVTEDLNIYTVKKYEQQHFMKYCESAYALYRILIENILKEDDSGAENLIISPTGPLTSFPFEVLVTNEVSSYLVDYHLPYLLKRYSISYAHSAGLLKMQSSVSRKGDRLLALGYGNDVVDSQRKEFLNLPGTISEVNAIAHTMDNDKNRFYVEQQASETVFKREAPDFNILHLALHGISDTLNALQSRLIFAGGDSLEDGQLYAHELYDLHLENLDLAVLSACESGIGKQQPGEGVMSIARGFAYAGCPSIVMSLWKIDDNTSAKVMSSFYSHVSEEISINKALTLAKLDYITGANEFSSHPSYWAAFIQIGNANAMEVNSARWWIYLSAGAGSLMLISIIWYRRRGRINVKGKDPTTIVGSFQN